MKEFLPDCFWTQEQLSEALGPLARAAGLHTGTANGNQSARALESGLSFEEWLDLYLSRQGLESEPIHISYGEVDALLRDAAPAILAYGTSQGDGYLVLLQRRWNRSILLKTDGSTCSVPRRNLVTMLCHEQREAHRPEFDHLLEFAGMNAAEQARALDALLKERLKKQMDWKTLEGTDESWV